MGIPSIRIVDIASITDVLDLAIVRIAVTADPLSPP